VPQTVHAPLDHDVGLVQMPCPEQRAWGGVLKTHLLALYGRGGHWAGRDRRRRPVSHALTAYTRLRVTPLARRVASDLQQYQDAGMQVVAVVGVGSSPSCGVSCTLDLDAALGDIASCPLRALTRTRMNEIVTTRTRPGPGIFTAAVQTALRRRRISVPFIEHDLRAELAGTEGIPTALPPLLRAQPSRRPPLTPGVR
jgi:predicted secreted protein